MVKFAANRLQRARLMPRSIWREWRWRTRHHTFPHWRFHAFYACVPFVFDCSDISVVHQVTILVNNCPPVTSSSCYWKCQESLKHLPKRRSYYCKTSPEMYRQNPRRCSMAMLSSFRRYPFVSVEICEENWKILLSSFLSITLCN